MIFPNCMSCKWRSDDFMSVCINSDSAYCADFVSNDMRCREYERADDAERDEDETEESEQT